MLLLTKLLNYDTFSEHLKHVQRSHPNLFYSLFQGFALNHFPQWCSITFLTFGRKGQIPLSALMPKISHKAGQDVLHFNAELIVIDHPNLPGIAFHPRKKGIKVEEPLNFTFHRVPRNQFRTKNTPRI